jgi:hypothetical protein
MVIFRINLDKPRLNLKANLDVYVFKIDDTYIKIN